jgi:hypothetical protein
VPSQIGFADAAMLMLAGKVGLTVKIAASEVMEQGVEELTITSNEAKFSEIFGFVIVKVAVVTPL